MVSKFGEPILIPVSFFVKSEPNRGFQWFSPQGSDVQTVADQADFWPLVDLIHHVRLLRLQALLLFVCLAFLWTQHIVQGRASILQSSDLACLVLAHLGQEHLDLMWLTNCKL